MHTLCKIYCDSIKQMFPKYFKNKRVLDVGSLDINGCNRHLFEDCEYIGMDITTGKNVDIVCVAHEYEDDKLFDVVLSTCSLEHDMHYKLTLKKMFSLLKDNGLMFIVVANSWQEHGTERTTPHNSATSGINKEWSNYYKNLNISDIKESLDFDEFRDYKIDICRRDLRFWGIKKDYLNICGNREKFRHMWE